MWRVHSAYQFLNVRVEQLTTGSQFGKLNSEKVPKSRNSKAWAKIGLVTSLCNPVKLKGGLAGQSIGDIQAGLSGQEYCCGN